MDFPNGFEVQGYATSEVMMRKFEDELKVATIADPGKAGARKKAFIDGGVYVDDNFAQKVPTSVLVGMDWPTADTLVKFRIFLQFAGKEQPKPSAGIDSGGRGGGRGGGGRGRGG